MRNYMLLCEYIITDLGELVQEVLDTEKILILFDEFVPEGLAEFSALHEKAELRGDVTVGDRFSFDEQQYVVTAIGDYANSTLYELGHACLVFDASTEASMPGNIHLAPAKAPSVHRSMRVRIEREKIEGKMQNYSFIDLSQTLSMNMPQTSALPRLGMWWCSRHEWDDPINCQQLIISEHHGTNVDAPKHAVLEGLTIDELPVDAFSGPACVLDFSSKAHDSEITSDDIREAEAALPESIEAGDIVLLRTGFDERNMGRTPRQYSQLRGRPTLSLEAARYLASKKVKAVGVDTVSPDVSGSDLPIHRFLLGEGILIIECLTHLDELPVEKCLFIALPLKIEGGSGSPVRAIALVRG